jgi:phytanoyl-CoA hydroxylase
MSLLRRTKLLYSIYNFFHPALLRHNETKLKELRLSKKYYSSLSSKDFEGLPGTQAVNSASLSLLNSNPLFQKLSNKDQESLLGYNDKGYAILSGFLSAEKVDRVNAEIHEMLKSKKVKFTNRNKIMFAIHQSALLREIGNDRELVDLLSILLNGKAILFQSINFITGSEQHTHSDSIHMTTYPLGGLLGAWFALEDITEDNGPLHYYPGSHKLPYYLNKDYNNEGNRFFIGNKSYKEYEKMIAEKIVEQGLEKVNFLAKKGDLLIWHANLFHGGNNHTNKNKTRKSMVFHYFKEGSICYHEITQRPALIKIQS